MKKIYFFVAMILCSAGVWGQNVTHLVISQVYGGGGNSGATYQNDFVELFNPTGSTVSLTGMSVQYAAATGTTWSVASLSGSIAPGKYYLIKMAGSVSMGVPLPAEDLSATGINMAGTAGKVVLASTTTAYTISCPSASVIDFVGFGTSANCNEGGSNAPAPSNTNADIRVNAGCTDANVNSTDFVAAAVAPRNSASTANYCYATAMSFPTPATQTAGIGFSITVTSNDAGGNTKNVTTNTLITLTATGSTIGGTTTGTILAGTSSIAISGVTLTASGGATITATATSGDALSPFTCSSFLVNAGSSPAIIIGGTPLAAFSTTAGTPSSPAQSYSVSGSNLTDDIVIIAPTGYQIKTGAGSYGSSLNLTPSGGTVGSTTIDVRLNSNTAGTFNGVITHTSTLATQQDVAVNGTVGLNAPTANSPNTFTATSFTADWAPGVTGAAVTNGYKLDVATSNTFAGAVAATLAGWSFEGGTSAANSGIAANLGNVISGNGVTNVTFNSSGNGGLTARADGWDNGNGTKYWELNLTTSGYSGISISSKQRGSGSGPRDFKLQYKIGAGGTYTDVPGGTIVTADNYTSGVLTNLSLPAACDNQASVYLRWIMTSNTSVSAATVLSGGAGNIDDIVINGTSISTYVPGYQDLSVTPTSQSVTVPGAGTYYYRVRATTGAVTSANSNVVTVVMNDQNTAAFRSIATGNFSSSGTWNYNVSGSFYTGATQGPGSGNNVTVQDGHTVTLVSAGAANGLTLDATGNVVLGNNDFVVNTITGGSSTSYIKTNGTGKATLNNINAEAQVPVGKAKYNPVTIENGSGHNWAVSVEDGVVTDPGFPADKAVLVTWNITPSVNPPAAPANITFQYDETSQVGPNFVEATAQQGWYRTTFWHPAGTASGVFGISGEKKIKVSGLTHFSPYAVSNLNGPLAISIDYFNGVKQSNNHLLNWKVTCTSTPTATMVLERSTDARNYSAIYSITATALQCQQPFNYTSTQPAPGTNYYRLKMTDATGKVSYSSIIALLNKQSGFDIIGVMPNPVTLSGTAILNVTAAQAGELQIVVTDMNGKKLMTQTETLVAGSKQVQMNLAKLSTGTYLVTGYYSDGTSQTVRILKQ